MTGKLPGKALRDYGARSGGGLRLAVAVLLLAPALSACILGSERPELNLEVPAAYREGGHNAPDAHLPALDWWHGFRSSELTSLMDAAQIGNLDIAVAMAQIVQADAQVGIAGAPLFPSATGTATAEQMRTPASAASGGTVFARTSPLYNLGISASYMVDFWGKNRALLYSAEESATASRYNREVVTLTAIVTVANAYFQILAAQDELRIARRNLAAAERILTLIKQQFAGGTASQLDVSQQEAMFCLSVISSGGMAARSVDTSASCCETSSCEAVPPAFCCLTSVRMRSAAARLRRATRSSSWAARIWK